MYLQQELPHLKKITYYDTHHGGDFKMCASDTGVILHAFKSFVESSILI